MHPNLHSKTIKSMYCDSITAPLQHSAFNVPNQVHLHCATLSVDGPQRTFWVFIPARLIVSGCVAEVELRAVPQTRPHVLHLVRAISNINELDRHSVMQRGNCSDPLATTSEAQPVGVCGAGLRHAWPSALKMVLAAVLRGVETQRV